MWGAELDEDFKDAAGAYRKVGALVSRIRARVSDCQNFGVSLVVDDPTRRFAEGCALVIVLNECLRNQLSEREDIRRVARAAATKLGGIPKIGSNHTGESYLELVVLGLGEEFAQEFDLWLLPLTQMLYRVASEARTPQELTELRSHLTQRLLEMPYDRRKALRESLASIDAVFPDLGVQLRREQDAVDSIVQEDELANWRPIGYFEQKHRKKLERAAREGRTTRKPAPDGASWLYSVRYARQMGWID